MQSRKRLSGIVYNVLIRDSSLIFRAIVIGPILTGLFRLKVRSKVTPLFSEERESSPSSDSNLQDTATVSLPEEVMNDNRKQVLCSSGLGRQRC